MTSHYNTTHESGATLARFESKAQTDEQLIREYFRRMPVAMRPSTVWRLVFNESVPIVSVRRAITNLTQAGYLEKLAKKDRGPWGRPEHYWQWREGAEE